MTAIVLGPGSAAPPRPPQRSAPSLRPARLGPLDLAGVASAGIRARRMRSGLTALGIGIGIAAMIAVLTISESSRASLLASLDALGTNLLTASPGQTVFGQDAALPDEAAAMIDRIGPVTGSSAIEGVNATVRRTDLIDPADTGGISVVAADLDLLDTLKGEVAQGRFLNAATARYPVTALGATAARRLGITSLEHPIAVWIGDQWFSVVGILEPLALTPELDRSAIIGHEIAADRFGATGSPSTIYVRTTPSAIDAVRGVLPATADPEHPEQVRVSRPSDALEARAAAATAFTGLFLGLGAVALLVGGIGIANMMLMAVLERRSEIGLRRALGATRGQIALQFLAEAGLLSGVGALAGVVVGAAIAAAYASTQGWPLALPVAGLAGGLGLGAVIGIVAGGYPAIRAASIPPTEALRSA